MDAAERLTVDDVRQAEYVFKNHPFGSRYEVELNLRRFTVVPSSPDLCRLLHHAQLLTNNRNDYLGVTGLTLISHPR